MMTGSRRAKLPQNATHPFTRVTTPVRTHGIAYAMVIHFLDKSTTLGNVSSNTTKAYAYEFSETLIPR